MTGSSTERGDFPRDKTGTPLPGPVLCPINEHGHRKSKSLRVWKKLPAVNL